MTNCLIFYNFPHIVQFYYVVFIAAFLILHFSTQPSRHLPVDKLTIKTLEQSVFVTFEHVIAGWERGVWNFFVSVISL